MTSLTADLVHRETPPPVVGGENPYRPHLYLPEIHGKSKQSKTPVENVQFHNSNDNYRRGFL
jgi:hypothetical protein